MYRFKHFHFRQTIKMPIFSQNKGSVNSRPHTRILSADVWCDFNGALLCIINWKRAAQRYNLCYTTLATDEDFIQAVHRADISVH